MKAFISSVERYLDDPHVALAAVLLAAPLAIACLLATAHAAGEGGTGAVPVDGVEILVNGHSMIQFVTPDKKMVCVHDASHPAVSCVLNQ